MTKEQILILEKEMTDKAKYLERWGGRSAEAPEILFLAKSLLEVIKHIRETMPGKK